MVRPVGSNYSERIPCYYSQSNSNSQPELPRRYVVHHTLEISVHYFLRDGIYLVRHVIRDSFTFD